MISVSKAEKEAIKERFPEAHIVRTMKQKHKRHRYYCEETRQVIEYLYGLRAGKFGGLSDSVNRSSGKEDLIV